MDAIYLLQSDKTLRRVERTDYTTEDLLQELIAKYPELLAGDQFDEEEPLRWLLVSRETPVPDQSGNRWSLDHLLVDQNAIPTFVEVKRSTDTRIRREVVGQMLDYAANGAQYWPVDEIRNIALRNAGSPQNLDEQVGRLLGPDNPMAANFWESVESNLRAGKVRLLFVADELPAELRAIIEFLNGKMTDIEVLGIELRQYVGEDVKAIVPKLVGKTEQIRRAKKTLGSSGRRTNEAEFLEGVPLEVRPFFGGMLAIAKEPGVEIYWGTKGFSLRTFRGEGMLAFAYGYPAGVFDEAPILSMYLKRFEPGVEADLRKRLLSLAPFQVKGKYTMDLPITEANLAVAMQALTILREIAQDGERPE